MRKFSIAVIAALLLVGIGCQSDNGAQKDDEKAEAQQASSEEESEEEKSKEESGDEHPGEEAEGQEHPGDEHPGEGKEEGEGEEHPGDEHPGDSAKNEKKDFTATDIKKAMKAHIESQSNDDGVFTIQDEKEGKKLKLKFVKIHDPVRKMEGKGYFGCTDFHVKGDDQKVYDLDFWLNPKDGQLAVTKSKVHKHPVKKDGEWTKKARYTFKNDEVVALD